VSSALPTARGLAAQPVRAVLFDLDGTLLDTAEDIATALNRALAEQQAGPLGVGRVRELIGRGAPLLVQRVVARLAPRPWPVDPVLLLHRFDFHYERLHAAQEQRACAYPGVEAGLAGLREQGVRIGVVTNKTHRTAAALLAQLRLSQWIDVLVGGDTVAQRKPHPQPLLHACAALQVSPRETLMVGDSATDVSAARAAGMSVVCVPYGYNEGADPRSLPCDEFIDSVDQLPRLLLGAERPLHEANRDSPLHPGR